jgi:hypothetical protein
LLKLISDLIPVERLDPGERSISGPTPYSSPTVADYLEERFEASGSRGGFMLRHSQAEQIEMLHSIVDLLVPELQRRGAAAVFEQGMGAGRTCVGWTADRSATSPRSGPDAEFR